MPGHNDEPQKVNQTEVTPCEPMALANTRVLAPKMDLIEHPTGLTIQLDLPGVNPERIQIEYEQKVLRITAPAESFAGSEMRLLVQEHEPGTYSRAFRVGERIDPERIEAHYEAGVLTLNLPKVEAAQPRKISVNLS